MQPELGYLRNNIPYLHSPELNLPAGYHSFDLEASLVCKLNSELNRSNLLSITWKICRENVTARL